MQPFFLDCVILSVLFGLGSISQPSPHLYVNLHIFFSYFYSNAKAFYVLKIRFHNVHHFICIRQVHSLQLSQFDKLVVVHINNS